MSSRVKLGLNQGVFSLSRLSYALTRRDERKVTAGDFVWNVLLQDACP